MTDNTQLCLEANPAVKGLVAKGERQGFVTLDDMMEGLHAEGARIMRRYLPCAVFDHEVFRSLRTYGASGYPFTAVDYEPPSVDDYPGFTAFQEERLFIPWSNRATPLAEPICSTRSTGRKSTPRSTASADSKRGPTTT